MKYRRFGRTELAMPVLSCEFDYVNLHWYFVNDLNWSAIPEARRRDMGVFIISPNDKGGKLYEPPEKLLELCAPLTPMQFNDLYCLARPEVHTLSCGAARPSDFDEHVGALAHYDRIPQTIAPLERRLREEMNRILGIDWCARWFEGLPQYVDVPGEINLLEILRLWNLCQIARPDCVGQNALQLAGPGGPLVSRRQCCQRTQARFKPLPDPQPFRSPNPCRAARSS